MKTIDSILSHVSEIYHLNKWRGEKKLLIYSDKISNSKMESFLRNAEKKLEKHVDDSTFRRRVFSMRYGFFPIDDTHLFFTLKVTVNKE